MPSKSYYVYDADADAMQGPFNMTERSISRLDDDLFGVYLLVSEGNRGGTIVRYVGRGNVKDRLLAHLAERDCEQFFFQELDDDITAFVQECQLFHKYGKGVHLDNIRHPARPAGLRSLPRCSEKGCNGELN